MAPIRAGIPLGNFGSGSHLPTLYSWVGGMSRIYTEAGGKCRFRGWREKRGRNPLTRDVGVW